MKITSVVGLNRNMDGRRATSAGVRQVAAQPHLHGASLDFSTPKEIAARCRRQPSRLAIYLRAIKRPLGNCEARFPKSALYSDLVMYFQD